MAFRVRLAAALLLLLGLPGTPSAAAQTGLRQVTWRAAEGLPQSLTLTVTVNPGGEVLTTHGPGRSAARLDGFNVASLTNFADAVGRVQSTTGGVFWSATRDGLRRVAGGSEESHPLPEIAAEMRANPLRALRPPPLLPLGDETLLVLLPDRLLAYDSATRAARVLLRAEAAGVGRFSELSATGPGALVLAAERGFLRLTDLAATHAAPRVEASPPADAVGAQDLQRPFPAADGSVVAAASAVTGGRRVIVRWSAKRLDVWPVEDAVRQAWPAADGAIWYHDGGDVFRFDPAGGPAARMGLSLEAGRIMDLAVEPDGAFWLATTEGLVRAAPTLWTHAPFGPPAGDAPALALAVDAAGRLAMVTPGRLWWRDAAGWQALPLGEPLDAPPAAEKIFPLAGDRWLVRLHGAGPEGGWRVARLPDGVLEPLPAPLSNMTPAGSDAEGRVLLLDADGPVVRGVVTFDGANISGAAVVPEDLGAVGRASFALGTRRGELWIGGESALLWRRGTNWTRFADVPSGARDGAFTALELPDGRLWVGGLDALREFDGETWRIVRRGLDRVNALAPGRDGGVWVAGAAGLHRFRDEAWTGHTAEEGLPATAAYAVLEAQDGTLWAGTARGAAAWNRRADRDPPRAGITGADTPAQAGDGRALLLVGGADRWDFTPPGRLQFSWRLDNGAWSPWRATAVVPLTNIAAGTHVFAVRALDRAGNVSSAPAVREFTVALRWFRDPRLLGVALVGAAAAAAFAVLAVNRHFRLRRSYAEVEARVRERTAALERANAELLHSQKMRALGTLAAGVAHDFNGLLSVIRGSAQLLEPNVNESPRAHARLQRILAAVEQGGGLVHAMLGFSRTGPRTGEALDPVRVIHETLNLLEESAARRVEFVLPAEPVPQLLGSAEMLRQVLVNLLRNADEAMNHEGLVTLRIERLDAPPAGPVLFPASGGPCLAITVADTGAGISPEHLARIFEPFFTTKGFSARRGTGLGLLMVHEFCKDLGYGLQVESQVGRGSRFRVLVPEAAWCARK
ncbi:MAG: ATP-binding protein [Limisphaerales bacterium]